MANFPPLACGSILLRVVLFDKWITKGGGIRWQAFKRMPDDTDGVSLFFNEAGVATYLKNPFPGLLTVHVGRVRDIEKDGTSLDVIQNLDDHAVIVNIPYVYDQAGDERIRLEALVIYYCRQLAEIVARLLNIAPPPAQNPSEQ